MGRSGRLMDDPGTSSGSSSRSGGMSDSAPPAPPPPPQRASHGGSLDRVPKHTSPNSNAAPTSLGSVATAAPLPLERAAISTATTEQTNPAPEPVLLNPSIDRRPADTCCWTSVFCCGRPQRRRRPAAAQPDALTPKNSLEAGLTWAVIVTVLVGANAGILFGVDLGITGGATAMGGFLARFFPHLLSQAPGASAFCQYNDVGLQLFTSSFFFAGMFSAQAGSFSTKKQGRRPTLAASAAFFTAGALMCALGPVLWVITVGRCLLGFGVGLGNGCTSMYLNEVAPRKWRGACAIMFQMATTIGILLAQFVNLGVSHLVGAGQLGPDIGWRLALGFGSIPGVTMLTLVLLFLYESPNYLVLQGLRHHKGDALKAQEHFTESRWPLCSHPSARATLQKLRGNVCIEEELAEMIQKAHRTYQMEIGNKTKPIRSRWKPRLLELAFLPFLVTASLIPLFQQLTGVNGYMFFAPQLFSSLGSGEQGALLNTVIMGVVNVLATLIAILFADRWGRKTLFYFGGVLQFLTLLAMALILKLGFDPLSGQGLSPTLTWIALLCTCLFVTGFAFSWGPLGWLVPAEVQPRETRESGAALCTIVNFAASAAMGQLFLTVLCALGANLYFMFAGWVFIMTLYVAVGLPETKGVQTELVADEFLDPAKCLLWGRWITCWQVPFKNLERSTGDGEDPVVIRGH